jgi:hypothetical protein
MAVSLNPTTQRMLANRGPQRHGQKRVDLNAKNLPPAIGKTRRRSK